MHFTKTGPDQYATIGYLMLAVVSYQFSNQGYTDHTCIVSKVFIDLVKIFRATLANKIRKDKEPLYKVVLKYGCQVKFKEKTAKLFYSEFLVQR